MVVRSLTDSKNNFVRSYPGKRPEELIANYDEEAIILVFYWLMRVELPHKLYTYIEYHSVCLLVGIVIQSSWRRTE